jgi:glycosyltransferase involved in cell wall biosynthesis
MRRLARRNRVLWVNSLGNRAPRVDVHDARRIIDKLVKFTDQWRSGPTRVEPNIYVLAPLAVPAYRSVLWRRANQLMVGATVRAAMKRLGFARPLVYTFLPASAWVVRRLDAAEVVYHCVDEDSQFAGAGSEIAALESELIRQSDLVITCSIPLLQAKRRLHERTILVRHGVEHAHFARALDEETPIPADIRHLPRPIFGFHGLVAEWVDLSALRNVAEAYPKGSLVIVGEHNHADRAGLTALRGLTNVHLLGRKAYAELPGYCKAFDVALLPFVKNQLTINASPLKLREYLAAGLPVVATDIPEAAALANRGVFLAAGPERFVTRVAEALAAGAGPNRARSQAMARESWDVKVTEIEQHLLELCA